MNSDERRPKSALRGCLMLIGWGIGLAALAWVALFIFVLFFEADEPVRSRSVSGSTKSWDEYFNCVDQCIKHTVESWPPPGVTVEDREKIRSVCPLTTKCSELHPHE